eukprot:16290366-Heterocapsa_arctica.AAC.1
MLAGEDDYQYTSAERDEAPKPDATLFGAQTATTKQVVSRFAELEKLFPVNPLSVPVPLM